MMIASLSLLVMNRTQEQDTASLEQFLAYPSCDKAENLQKDMISFDNELERLIDSDFLINPQLEGHALTKLTKVIRSQDRHKFDIALFWAQIPRTICHNTRVAQMRQIIQQTIADYPTRRPQGTAQIHAALATKIRDWICFGHREYNHCNKTKAGHTCNFLHMSPRPTTECTNAAYVAGNECSNFNKCKHLHPKSKRTIAANPANKPKTETGMMMHESCSLALNRARRENAGQDTRERYIDTTDYDQMLTADVPEDEMQAALIEPVSSNSSEQGSEEELTSRSNVTDIEDDIRDYEAWGRDDEDYEPKTPSTGSETKTLIEYEDDFSKLFDEMRITDGPNLLTNTRDVQIIDFDNDLSTISGENTPSSIDSQATVTDSPTEQLARDFESDANGTDGSDNPLGYFGIDDDDLEPVEIYTPPATQESDLARDEREATKEDIEPMQLG